MSAFPEMVDIKSQLIQERVDAIAPLPFDPIQEDLSVESYALYRRRLSLEYLRKIRDPRTYAILAVNVDRYGFYNYIGPHTLADIAIAFAQSKKIYIYQGVPDVYQDELTTWGAISLGGVLDPLVRDYQNACAAEQLQLTLF